MKNRLDPTAKRGAVVKSLAFGSHLPHLPESFKPVALALLDRIFLLSTPDPNYDHLVKDLLSTCFDHCNSPELLFQLHKGLSLDRLHRSLYLTYHHPSSSTPHSSSTSDFFPSIECKFVADKTQKISVPLLS
jgi:hypothetical protein